MTALNPNREDLNDRTLRFRTEGSEMNARMMRRAMEFARSLGMPVIDHCEDLHLSAGGDMHEGLESVRLGLRGIRRF